MEKYGEKPKRFTAARFEYVWDYYKIHIIVGILLIIAVVYTWIAISSQTYYDLYVCFSGDYYISKESQEKLTEALKSSVSDINGDGEINIYIADYSVPKNFDDVEYISAMKTKFHLELQTGDTFVFILPPTDATTLTLDPQLVGLFDSPKSWGNKNSDNAYFAKIENSDVFQHSGILYKDLYIGVRNFRTNEGNEEDKKQRENAISAANFILGN